MREPLEVLVKELVLISKGVGEGLFSIIVPPPLQPKNKWCICGKCGKLHTRAS